MKRIPADMVPGTVNNTAAGDIKIIEYNGSKSVKIEFVETGFSCVTSADSARKGLIRDRLKRAVYGVGFMGVGPHKAQESGSKTKAYKAWTNMLERCYSDYRLERFPTYSGCRVCDGWHNFQSFAEWFYANYPEGENGYHLDKDTKVPGNKVYSPETCLIISAFDNVSASSVKSYRFKSPGGDLTEVTNLLVFCKDRGLSHCCMRNVYTGRAKAHKGWTKA